MKCEGHYEDDRICGLCYETNLERYRPCREKTVKYRESKKSKTIIEFIAKHCKYINEYYAEGEDHYECTATECIEGYHDYCEPFGEQCMLKKT